MNFKNHYTNVKNYYNKSTEAWIETYRRTQSFRFNQFLDEHDNILKEKIFKKPGLYLDAGCGDFSFSKKICKKDKKIKIIGVTVSEKQVEIAKVGCPYNCSVNLDNFENLSFKDNTFDGCFFIESFSHSLNKDKTCKEIQRVVKNNGFIYILDLNVRNNCTKNKVYWGWYNIFYFLPIKYQQSLKLFKKYFKILQTSTDLTNYRKFLYRKLRTNVDFDNCECTYLNTTTPTVYGLHHLQQNTFNLPVVWSEFIMQNNK